MTETGHKILRWGKYVLTSLMILWGTFAALVAFAVRYELGVFAPLEAEPDPSEIREERIRVAPPRLVPSDWDQLLNPDAITRAFEAALSEQPAGTSDTFQFDHTRLELVLDYRPTDSTAVWKASYKIGCDCPYASPDATPRLLALIHPLTGRVLDLYRSQGSLTSTNGDTLTGHTGGEVRP